MYIKNIGEIDAVIFDMDGTLIDSLHVWVESDVQFITEQGYEYDEQVSEHLKTLHFRSACDYLKEHYSLPMSSEEIGERIMELVEEGYLNRVPLKDGVCGFLELLTGNGIKYCVATSNDRYLAESSLKKLGIYDKFEFLITSDEVGGGKETPRIFLECAERLGADIKKTVVFEDSLHALLSAKAGGFKTVGVYEARFPDEFSKLENEADFCIKSFEELL